MITKKTLIIEKYLKMNEDIKIYINENIFPELWDVIDILFYFNYHFIKPNDDVQTVDDILELNNINVDDDIFGKVCDVIIDFLNLIRSL